jgi:sugar (pentulose or hexulose) kinase
MKTPAIAIFDIGKTNKKLFLFNETYEIVFEKNTNTTEIPDEDGFMGDNIDELNHWLLTTWQEIKQLPQFEIKALNFSSYGASFVQVDHNGKPVSPLYNYLKPFTPKLLDKFYTKYGGKIEFPKTTASPILGNLNSGMQLYSLKYEKSEIYKKTHLALHLPQYLSAVFTHQFYSEITSIGCHTNLWDFTKMAYHHWVSDENIDKILAQILPSDETIEIGNIAIGIGLHDSSSALIPYLLSQKEEFLLISTGTWCISLNPFNKSPLTTEELNFDCLAYLTFQGKPVKASRLFAGQFHENETKRIAQHFNLKNDFYKLINYNSFVKTELNEKVDINKTAFTVRELNAFESAEQAYHQLIADLIAQQIFSTKLILKDSAVNNIFVDGGFSKNEIYMHLLARAFPEKNIYAAEVSQASAIGAALIIHSKWNSKPIPDNLISLKKYNNA